MTASKALYRLVSRCQSLPTRVDPVNEGSCRHLERSLAVARLSLRCDDDAGFRIRADQEAHGTRWGFLGKRGARFVVRLPVKNLVALWSLCILGRSLIVEWNIMESSLRKKDII